MSIALRALPQFVSDDAHEIAKCCWSTNESRRHITSIDLVLIALVTATVLVIDFYLSLTATTSPSTPSGH
jgi:hypothetical protein